jgi:hypothetical protein
MVLKYYGFSDAIANFIAWISKFFPVNIIYLILDSLCGSKKYIVIFNSTEVER